jgi:uncharacterized protein (TIGR00251 family)
MADLKITEAGADVILTVKVVPGSSRTAVAGVLDGMVKVKVAAAAEKGKANECLVEFLAKSLGIRKNDIEIISGHTSPVKQVHIRAMSKDGLISLLGI